MTDLSVISQLQNAFDAAIGSGFSNIQGDVNWLFATITILTIALTAALSWAWGDAESLLRSLIQRILLIGFVGYLVGNWHSLTMMIVDGMTQLGLKAGGSSISFNTFLNSPEQLVSDGFNLAQKVYNVCAGCNLIANAGWLIVYLFATGMIMLAMFWLAIQVFVTTLEFKLVTLASMIFVPFAVWQKTTFLSDRALSYAFSVGAKLLALALVTTIGSQLLIKLTVSTTPNLENAAALVLACFTVLILALSAGSLASALVTGGPQLGAGAFIGAAAATAAMGGAAYLGGRQVAGRNPSPLQRYTAGVRAGVASGAAGGNFGQRFMAGLKGAAFPGAAAAPSQSPNIPSASGAPPPGPTPPAPSRAGGVASRTAQAVQTASRATQETGRGSFGPTNLHDPEN